MSVYPFIRPIGFAATVIAIIQAVIWLVLSLTGILVYTEVFEPTFNTSFYTSSVANSIFLMYLKESKEVNSNNEIYVGARELYIWMLVYMGISLFWLILSGWQFWVIQHEKSQFVKKTFLGWSLWTFIISVADISLSILLSLDYGYFVGLYPEQIEKGNYGFVFTILAAETMTGLSARGYVVLIMNIVFAIVMMKMSFEHWGRNTKEQENIEAFRRETLFGKDNQTFDWKSGGDNFTRSNSFANALVEARHENLAKINKKPGTSTLSNVPPPQVPIEERWPYQLPIPRIPVPDYTPPSSPRYQKPLKSVLKNRASALYGPSSSTKF